jgi:hypothetical protein
LEEFKGEVANVAFIIELYEELDRCQLEYVLCVCVNILMIFKELINAIEELESPPAITEYDLLKEIWSNSSEHIRLRVYSK